MTWTNIFAKSLSVFLNRFYIYPSQTKWMSKQSKQMKLVKWKGIIFNAEKILSQHIEMQNVCLSLGRNCTIFTGCVNLGQIFTASTGKSCSFGFVWPAQWGPPPGPWSGKSPFQRILSFCKFLCYVVVRYHFGKLAAIPTTI